MSDETNEKPKIIIDEDWKSKVEAEREALERDDTSDATAPTAAEAEAEGTSEYPLPPASFDFLVSSIFTQVLAALGQFPNPEDGKSVVRLDLAKHQIDLLAMLQDKTRGNLSSDESKMLDEVLHQVRMMYVSVQSSTGQREKRDEAPR